MGSLFVASLCNLTEFCSVPLLEKLLTQEKLLLTACFVALIIKYSLEQPQCAESILWSSSNTNARLFVSSSV